MLQASKTARHTHSLYANLDPEFTMANQHATKQTRIPDTAPGRINTSEKGDFDNTLEQRKTDYMKRSKEFFLFQLQCNKEFNYYLIFMDPKIGVQKFH